MEDSKQQLYTYCSHVSSNGMTCTNPVPKYLDPLLCGGHWDQGTINIPSDTDPESEEDDDRKEDEHKTEKRDKEKE